MKKEKIILNYEDVKNFRNIIEILQQSFSRETLQFYLVSALKDYFDSLHFLKEEKTDISEFPEQTQIEQEQELNTLSSMDFQDKRKKKWSVYRKNKASARMKKYWAIRNKHKKI